MFSNKAERTESLGMESRVNVVYLTLNNINTYFFSSFRYICGITAYIAAQVTK